MTTYPLILIRAAGLPFETVEPLRGHFSEMFRTLDAGSKQEAVLREALLQSMDDALATLPESPLRTTIYNARRDAYNHRDAAFQRSMRRLSTTGFDQSLLAGMWKAMSDWLQKKEEKSEVEQAIRQEYTAATQQALLQLQRLAANSDPIRRTLLFASHDLLDALPDFIQTPLTEFARKERSTAFSLAEYLCRAAFKTSPFSRLTTVALWRWADPDAAVREMEYSGIFSGSKAIVTPNVALLPLLYEVLLCEPAFFRSLSVSLNPTFRTGSLSSSTEKDFNWLYFDGERESFQQMPANAVSELVVHTLLDHGGKMPFVGLLAVLENAVEADSGQLQALVVELIDWGLLEWGLPEPGLSPGWCGSLYQYLGYLPSAPVLTDTAFLLQWLRTAARVLPHQPLGEAQETQREAAHQVNTFFKKYGVQAGANLPFFTGQQIFFEDVERSVQTDVPKAAVERIVAELRECWQQKLLHTLPPFRARLFAFAQKMLAAEGDVLDFLAFSQQFLQQPREEMDDPQIAAPRYTGKIGALLQIFQENGAYRAVVNALFPGGGKLFARWLHLLPTDARDVVEKWGLSAPFPAQGWSNANFQPSALPIVLQVPGGRMSPVSGGEAVPLSECGVRLNAAGMPQLVHRPTGLSIQCTDLGLESPDTYPPVMQVLWHLTVPYVSKEALLPESTGRIEQIWGGRYPRVERESLVLRRQIWEVRPEIWRDVWAAKTTLESDFFLRVRPALVAMELPSRFFARFSGQRDKPLFLDYDSPLLMSLFAKMLRRGAGNLLLTEMLPVPDQYVANCDGMGSAAEFVIEMEV